MAISSTTTLDPQIAERVNAFVVRWEKAKGKERSNYQMFFAEFCDVLGVERPNPQGSTIAYEFDYSMTIYTPSGKKTPGYIDFYKEKHFVIEAKQGREQSGQGTAKRGTQAYLKVMEGAFVQAIAYARNVASRPPFVLTCDIGSHFELWMGFGEEYGGYGARREIGLAELRKPEIFALFVDIFTNPQARNPEKIAAIVTREVAADLAELAKLLEVLPFSHPLRPPLPPRDPQEVARFLMRCIFTMFAEDVGLLKEQLFTETLETRWLKNPREFRSGAEDLWEAMNQGNKFGFYGKLLQFNGGLFSEATAFELTKTQLEVLLSAAKRDWRNVEPAIFGTLLERALDNRERSKLGAHYTPRSYVERLVRPVVLEPLRDRWAIVQAEVMDIVKDAVVLTPKQVKDSTDLLEAFLSELRSVKVLDPACGSGNFLYVTLDLMKQLETEVFQRLADVTGSDQFRLDIEQVGPAQFLGIEINPRAASIADLVIWIGYLQWHFKRFGDVAPIEPVLREYKNIECRDAVLDYADRKPDKGRDGKVRSRWGGRLMKSPVTGEDIPDATDQVPIWKYIKPRQAEWPEANYIVSNPPFIGNARMRDRLGDGYTEILRKAYKDVPDTVDFVMYWWHKAAELVRSGKIKRFGLITTNSISQIWQRKVIASHLSPKSCTSNSLRLLLAIPDHPWSDEGADVRIAMTGADLDGVTEYTPQLGKVVSELKTEVPEDTARNVTVEWQHVGQIFSDLRAGANLLTTCKLQSNDLLAGRGVCLHGAGFILSQQEFQVWGHKYLNSIVKPYLNGRDLVGISRKLYVIDFFGCSEVDASQYSEPFQKILEEVKPERNVNKREVRKKFWWLFGENMPKTRGAIKTLNHYICIPETSKHRIFQFLDSSVLPDNKLIVIALEDAYFLGVLSSNVHVVWSLAVGGLLEDRPVYVKTICFDRFPFPDPTEAQKQKIRELGDRLDSHRKRVQAAHPEVTITAMYNLVEKLRNGETLDDKDKAFNQKALVSTLKQIHDELDLAVFSAYGWEDLGNGEVRSETVEEMILERLVKLNADRAEEEENGLIRWLRPEYQAPETIQVTQTTLDIPAETITPIALAQQELPKAFKDQLAAIRDLLRTQGGEWTVDTIAQQFKNASRSESKIQDAIDALETLGIVTRHTENEQTTWYFTDLQTMSNG